MLIPALSLPALSLPVLSLPVLSGAVLSGAVLSGAVLSGAVLSGAAVWVVMSCGSYPGTVPSGLATSSSPAMPMSEWLCTWQ
ncbi:pentapeptide repeat-containing protein [Streptomyces sp. NPDC087532]